MRKGLIVSVFLAAGLLSIWIFQKLFPGENELHVHELKMILKKIDGEWRIKQVESVKTLVR